MKQLIRRHGRNHRFVLEAGRLVPKGADPIIPQEGIPVGSGARIVSGAVLNDATIDEGSGFTAKWSLFDDSHPNENYITIMFDVPFEAGPIVAFGVNNDNNASGGAGDDSEYQVGILTRNVAYIEVVGKELDGTPNIGGFDFVAIEAAA